MKVKENVGGRELKPVDGERKKGIGAMGGDIMGVGG